MPDKLIKGVPNFQFGEIRKGARMIMNHVLTLKEVAEYLRISEHKCEKRVLETGIPGRKIGNEWRFLKSAVDDWLQGRDTRTVLLSQAGSLSDDEMLDDLRALIYSERGRPETEEPDAPDACS